MEELQNMRTKMEQYRVSKDPALQKTMSVPEMRKLLGLKKTESYWLVHRNFFKTEIIGGVMRIDIESFEKWYANQVKHKKVNGEAPGKELKKTSYSFQEAANLLGVNNANLYEIWKKENRNTITVDFVMRIPKEEFEKGCVKMAFIRKRGKKFSVIYRIKDDNGKERQTSETFSTQKDAERRQKEIEYKMAIGKFEVPKCTILEELIEEYVKIYGHDKWGVSTYAGNISLINNYILPTIGKVKLSSINTHFMEKYYKDLLEMPAVKSSKNMDGTGTITESTVNEIHKILRSAFRQAVKWDLMEKNPAVDATVPKAKTQEREIWTAEMLMQALEACDNKMLKIAFHLAFTATLRIGELLGLTWDEMDISEEAIANNRSYVIISKQVERVSRDAVEALNSKEIILIFPTSKKNNKTVRVLKTPKTDSSTRKVYIPKSVAQCLVELKAEQDEIKEALGNEYQDYNLVMATTFGLPIGDSYLRNKMQDIIDELGLPDVVFHSLRHTSVTYKLKLSGGDIKAVQGDSGHAQADMVTEVYGHIIDEDRRKNAEMMENAFYNKENLNPQMKGSEESSNMIAVPEGVDVELLMKVLGNPEMTALLTSLAKTMKV